MCRKLQCGGATRSANAGHISAGVFAASAVLCCPTARGSCGAVFTRSPIEFNTTTPLTVVTDEPTPDEDR
jgi:hypothetical protein